MKKIKQGEQKAFETLIKRHQNWVFHYTLGMLGNKQDAEDLTQDVFWQIYKKLDRYKETAKFSTWLRKVVVNKTIDWSRKNKHKLPKEQLVLHHTEESPAELLDKKLQREELRNLVISLPEEYRSILVLRYWHDLSNKQIAEITDQPLTVVKNRLYRGRRMLLDAWQRKEAQNGL